VIIPHEEYLKLGKERENRAHNYRELFTAPLSGRDVHLIRNAAHFSHPVGNAQFVESVEQQIGKENYLKNKKKVRLDLNNLVE
jgi:putative transposase